MHNESYINNQILANCENRFTLQLDLGNQKTA